MNKPCLLLERPMEGLALLSLQRPTRMNAMDVPSMRQLKATLDEVADDPSIRVLILTGQGRGFCAGLDWSRCSMRRATIGSMQPSPTRCKQCSTVSCVGSSGACARSHRSRR
jgi:enoyl-CoA hydratase/carnithine racemase